MQIKTYEKAIDYLEGFIGKIRFRIDPEFIKHNDPLERMRALFSLLGNPQDKFKSVLVGGTSGKGSTAYLISHILTTAGYKTGLTLSPHLQKVNERLQIDNEQVSNKKFVELVNSLVQTIKLMKQMEVGEPSYFEILIAMAFLYFADEKVEIAIVEVGMGGEFDATNTLYPLVAVLTNVSLDHTNILGGTVEKIARTKAGIIKKNQESRIKNQGKVNSLSSIIHDSLFMIHPVVVTGVKQPSVIKIVEDRCKEVGAELFRLGKDFDYKIKKESIEGTVFDLTTPNGRGEQLNVLELSLLGEYQVENASLAIEAVLQLEKFGLKASQQHIRKALKTAFFAGRFEIVRFKGSPHPLGVRSSFRGEARPYDYSYTLILDGAHNPTKMKEFLKSLKKLFPKNRKVFVVGFKFDKDVKKMLEQIAEVADNIIITEFRAKTDVSKNASVDALKLKTQIPALPAGRSKLKTNRKVIVEEDSKKALDKAVGIATMKQLSNETIIVVTGSLYLVGEVRNML